MRNSEEFKKATETIELLMRKEIGVKDVKSSDIAGTKKLFWELNDKIKEADVPLRIYNLRENN